MDQLETERLRLRRLTLDDAPFILRLVNEPAWLQFIGDKGVRNLDEARRYLRKGPLELYARFGFGPLAVEFKTDATPIGVCGLLKRETLPDADIGFAFFPHYWGQGYAFEAATAVLADARQRLGLKRILALTAPANVASIRLLGRLGLKDEGMVRGVPDAPESKLFGWQA
jgi:RimJ/RimL family protein N-acetyltransferase